MSTIPEDLKRYAQIDLLPEFYRRVEFQVAIRDIDGPLPWPEQLERPGWRVRFPPEGLWSWEIPVPPDPPSMAEPEPATSEVPETRTVEPELVAEVEIVRGLYRVALGWSVPDRVLVVFHTQKRSHYGD